MKFISFLFIIFSHLTLNAQHLPLQIQNQWHYDGVIGFGNYAAIAVDTLIVNDKNYFEIERRHYSTGELLMTTYDRLDGDSAYYRIWNGDEYLIINFNWPDGYTQVVQTDSNCINITLLSRGFINVWGFNTEVYNFYYGFWCAGMNDTDWVLTPYSITRLFGSRWAVDGALRGAIINGTTYGDLHPLPVELVSFSANVNGNNVTLSWATASEMNNQGFGIERKNPPVNPLQGWENNTWEMIGFVEGNGTTTETKSYLFTDYNLSAGQYKYRLKQINFDGTFEYLPIGQAGSNIVEADILFPDEFNLHQNYPNPFNPNTTISWQQPSFSKVSIKVYDILGTEIKTLVDKEYEAGNHEIKFDASLLSAGVYFYTLQSGSFSETKKLTILK